MLYLPNKWSVHKVAFLQFKSKAQTDTAAAAQNNNAITQTFQQMKAESTGEVSSMDADDNRMMKVAPNTFARPINRHNNMDAALIAESDA
jgi:hypothetical protein